MKNDGTAVVAGLVALVLIVLSFYGWVNNIVELVRATSVTGLVLLRAVGVFVAPIGVIMGYI